jgi:hypothetical protein
MIALWLVCTLCLLTQVADAQSFDSGGSPRGVELELPDVMLFGRDTVYLSVPPPQPLIDLPLPPGRPGGSFGSGGERLQLPDRVAPQAVPAPPVVVPVGSSLRAGPSPGGRAAPGVDASQPGTAGTPGGAPPWESNRAWDASLRYIPTLAVSGELAGESVRGAWSAVSLLSLALPDGWADLQPNSPGHVLFAARGARDGVPVRFSVAASGGVLDPPVNPRTYTLGASQHLEAAGRLVEFSEATALQLQSREDPAAARVAAASQGFRFLVRGRTLGLSLEADATARLESGSSVPATNATLTALASYRTAQGSLQIAAGGSALHYESRLSMHPALAVEVHPLDWLTLRGRAAAFLQLAPQPELYAVYTPVAASLLGPEGGYRIESILGVDFTPAFEASGSGWYVDGRLHEFEDDDLLFDWTRQAGAALQLAWRSPSWASLHARGSAAWDLTGVASLARRSASAWLQADFSKVPVTLIMLVSWGDLLGADAGARTEPALLSEWEIFSGFGAAIRGSLRFRPDQAVEAGLQLLVSEETSTLQPRFLVGYKARLRAPVTNSRRR